MPNPDEAPSHEGDVDDVGQAHVAKPTAGVRTRTRTVMARTVTDTERFAYFQSDTTALSPIALDWSTYIDMGRPDRITVTIEPGDRLNE